MPTSGESGIGLSSTYNLRRRPLPKTAPASRPTSRSSNNKENVGTRKAAPTTRLTKKTEQSTKIPVPNSRIPVPRSTRSSASKTASSSTPTRRKVPDFEKLHKSWTQKFQQGKAVAKKPCTQAAAFDLTRPGTHFKRAFYDGTKKDVKSRRQTGIGITVDDDFEVDGGALNDILNGKGLEEEEEKLQQRTMPSRATLAGTGVSSEFTTGIGGRRQTLGRLPSTGAGRVNNTSNVSSGRETDKRVMHHGKKSLLQEQRDAGINFEASADALASILNNTGLQASDKHHNIIGGRQTIAGMSAKQRQSGRFHMTTGRTSIYYQKPKNHDMNKVYSEFAKRTLSRFTMDGNQANFKNAFIDSLLPDNRGSLYIKPSLPASEKPVGTSHAASDTSTASSVSKTLSEPSLPASEKPAGTSHAASDTSTASSVSKTLGAITPGRVPITPGRVPVTDKTKSAGTIGRTPGTAARIPNPHFSEALGRQEQSCSPALTPARRIPTTPGGQSQKNVRWADVLSSPTEGDRADHMSTKDVVAVLNFGDDEDAVSPETKTRLHEVEKLEAETVVNRQKLNEMEEIERQLELEIARLHEDGDIEESSEQPASHASSVVPHIVTNQHAKEPHISNLLDHVPTKQPADYIDPIKLPKEAVNVHASQPAPAFARPGVGMPNMELHQHALRDVQHPQHRFQRGQSHMQMADMELSQHPQDRFHRHQSHMQMADLEREFSHQHRDRSAPSMSNLPDALPARGRDMMMKESSSSYVPYLSQNVPGIPDKLCTVDTSMHDVRNVSDSSRRLRSPSVLDGRSENGLTELMLSDSTEAFRGVFPAFLQNSCHSSRRPEGQGYPTAIAGQEAAEGHTVSHAHSTIKPSVHDFANSGGVDLGYNVNAHIGHHPEGNMDNKNILPSSSAYGSIRTIVTSNPHSIRTDSQSSLLNASAASTKMHMNLDTQQPPNVPTKTIPPMENPRLTIHTPQPVQGARGGTSFFKPMSGLRSISTPLHHSSAMPTPIQTPLSMRNSSLALSSRRDHQQWASPVVAPNASSLQSYGHNASQVPVPNALNTATLQQSHTQSTQPTFSNSFGHASMADHAPNAPNFQSYSHNTSQVHVPFPNALNTATLQQSHTQSTQPTFSNSFGHASMADYAPNAPHLQSYGHNVGQVRVPNALDTATLQRNHTQSTQPTFSSSFGHASMAEHASSSLIHPVSGPLQTRLDHPTTAAAFQYRRPHASSVSSERTRMLSGQGQSAEVARSLSLSDSLMGGRSREQVVPVSRQMKSEREASSQLFHQVLLDEECALYACRLKGRYTPQSVEPRPINPIAKVLLHGDDMHFVPVRDIEFLVSSPTGSAFSNYYTNS